MLWVELCLPKGYDEVLTSSTLNVNFLGNMVFVDIINLRWGHHGEHGIQYDRCPNKKKEIWIQRHTGKMARGDRGKYWVAYYKIKNAWGNQKL